MELFKTLLVRFQGDYLQGEVDGFVAGFLQSKENYNG